MAVRRLQMYVIPCITDFAAMRLSQEPIQVHGVMSTLQSKHVDPNEYEHPMTLAAESTNVMSDART